MDPKDWLKELARQALQAGKPETWFEPLYNGAAGDPSTIPWADGKPNPHLVAWLDREQTHGDHRQAIVIGCGLGDDAEELQRRGFTVTAFDISPSAIEWARKQFPTSKVDYQVADLLQLPPQWIGRFDFVFEAYTVQAMPQSHREDMLRAVASLVAARGELLVVCRGRDEGDDPGSLPWPLTKGDLATLENAGLSQISFEDFVEQRDEPVRRFRAFYRR